MPIKTAEELHSLARRVLAAAGADEESAGRVADALVLSDLSGVATHGTLHLPGYVKSVRDGYTLPNAKPETVRETPTSALVKGNWAFGFVSAMYALELAMEKAADQAVAVVSLVQANHIGRLGEYAETAAARGMVSLIWSGGQGVEAPLVVPYGGSRPTVLSTNPMAIGVPAGDEPPMVLDFATTAVAHSKAVTARNENKSLPPDAIVDKHGQPSTDPADLLDGGALLPFGGHKGYAIMLANELLGRVLAGADSHAVEVRGGPFMRHQGVTFIVLRADIFQPMAGFNGGADALLRQVKSVPPAPGFDEVLVPGDLEDRARPARRRDGIPVNDKVWGSLVELAESLGVEVG